MGTSSMYQMRYRNETQRNMISLPEFLRSKEFDLAWNAEKLAVTSVLLGIIAAEDERFSITLKTQVLCAVESRGMRSDMQGDSKHLDNSHRSQKLA